MRFFSVIAILVILLVGCFDKSDTTSPASIAADEASVLVSELPEVKSWAAYIERTTEGKVRASIMVLPERPVIIGGYEYWTVNFYESHPTHMSRWETFLVRLDAKEIKVDDAADGVINLEVWRTNKRPMERTQGTSTP